MRQRVAPIASRTAISFVRAELRASRRFATFAHAINSTIPTTPISKRATEESCCRRGGSSLALKGRDRDTATAICLRVSFFELFGDESE